MEADQASCVSGDAQQENTSQQRLQQKRALQ